MDFSRIDLHVVGEFCWVLAQVSVVQGFDVAVSCVAEDESWRNTRGIKLDAKIYLT